jgi:hypothetical protein
MGRLGFEHADRVLAGDSPEPRLLPTEVVLRGSTAAPGAQTLPGEHLPIASPVAANA